MNMQDLPFDADAALERLRGWVEIESPTFDSAAVNKAMDRAADDLASIGGRTARIPGTMGYGDCVVAQFGATGPGILVMGHLDTVHPVGTLEVLPFAIEDGRCSGPGILDMKGGCVAALEAIASLSRVGRKTPLPVTVLLTSDEEVGSPSTRGLIEDMAGRNKYVLVPEPALGAGGLVTGRYAISRYRLAARGRPSHAGQALKDGRSAISLMARKIIEIEALTTEDYTFSVGTIHGGQWVNCVPTLCNAEALSMAKRQADLDLAEQKLMALAFDEGGPSFGVEPSVARPVWEPSPETLKLYELARGIALELGQAIDHGSDGGGSDANFTGHAGIPTLDGLGLTGRGLHTLEEYIEIDSLEKRTRLIAGLLMRLQ